MPRHRAWMVVALVLGTWGLAGCAAPVVTKPPLLGTPANLGNGYVTSFAEVDATGAPMVIGVMFSASAVENLPAGSDGHACHDANRDGKIDPIKECLYTHERVLPLPSELARRADMPFKWAMLNWNPRGHIPPRVYDTAHFDVHFMIEPIENIYAIHPGPCGPEHARCDQFAIGRRPMPANYVPASHIDVGAVVPAMGNHLVNVTGPEISPAVFPFVSGSNTSLSRM